ncbi:MAG: DUF2203 domain-containing protein [Gemmatimonadales bacterium]
MTETAVRHFTATQANATLPLVRRIVGDLLDIHPRWRAAIAEFETEQARTSANGETPRASRARLEAERLAREIEACLDELDQVGCLFKGFDGLVDFPSVHDGREVFLCWRYNEPRVEHWHELDSGFAGRQQFDSVTFPADE